MRVYIEEQSAVPASNSFLRKYSGTLVFLVLLAVATLGWSALTPSVMGDEWFYLVDHIRDGGPACPELAIGARPLSTCWMAFVYRLVGPNASAFHAFGIVMNLISALLLLATLDILLPKWASYNGAVVALYIVLPADMTRTWLGGNIVIGAALLLLVAWPMARFWRDGRWWAWFASMVAIAINLGFSEVTVGVIIALSGLAFLFGRHRTWPQRLGLLAPAIVAVGFSLWRWNWQQTVGYAYGHDISRVAVSPMVLISRLYLGFRYLLGEAWATTILSLQPFISPDGRVARLLALGLLIGLVALAILLARRISLNSRRFDSSSARQNVGIGETLDLLKAGAVGLVILAAGYFPIILAIGAGTGYTGSHAHQIPSIGASLVICAVLFGASQWLARTPARARFIALAGLVPLLAVGIAGHVMVTRQLREAWAEQKLIWHSLFEQAPDIADGTHVLVLLEGYDVPGRGPRPMISGPFGISAALQLLYDKDELSASFVPAPASRTLSIGDEGDLLVFENARYASFSAAETLVFVFSRADQRLVQLKELENGGEVLSLGPERIIHAPAAESEWRWLVAD